jgi:hypothetical protein
MEEAAVIAENVPGGHFIHGVTGARVARLIRTAAGREHEK